MNRLRLAALSVCAGLFTTFATSAPVAAAGGTSGTTWYLSLGDSLSQGVQPNAAGVSVITNQGYADQLFQIEQAKFSKLTLVKMGCPGENTTTMIHGGLCTYEFGSQLADAVDFLSAHRNHMAFVTLDIGGNDLNICAPLDPATGLPRLDPACFAAGINSIGSNLPVIIAALKAADPNVIVGMNYFNPFLAIWLFSSAGQALYPTALGIGDIFTAELGAIYSGLSCHWDAGLVCGAGSGTVLPVADVSTAFQTDVTTPVDVGGGFLVPLDVVRICQWTWMCAPFPRGPNIHANQAGYGVIAHAFAAKL
jgi:lysophospholipase L1-like esterase